MEDNLPTFIICEPNLFNNGGRRWDLVFFRFLLQFNYLGPRKNEATIKWFLIFGYESTRTIQVPATCNQVRAWEFGDMHENVHTIAVHCIEPILEI